MRKFAVLSILIFVLSGCATSHIDPNDRICSEIASFANTITAKSKHSVMYRTAWGSGLSNADGPLYELQCKHDGYDPGITLCKYLEKNTSIEFNSINIDRALRCFPGAPPISQTSETSVKSLHGEVSSSTTFGVRKGTKVTLNFSTGGKGTDPYLQVTAERLGE